MQLDLQTFHIADLHTLAKLLPAVTIFEVCDRGQTGLIARVYEGC